MTHPPSSLSIKYWSEEDQPREKLINHGKAALSNAELIAILIGSGTRKESAVELSRKILFHYNNDLNAMGKVEMAELKKFKGIGEAKAISIIAALELSQRRKAIAIPKQQKITGSEDAFSYMQATFQDLPHEEFWLVCLSRSNQPISKVQISKGGVSGTVVDVKLIFKAALDCLASSVIVFHNHPSGSLQPSTQDKQLTKKIAAAGKAMDIPLLDHLILTDYNYFSFSDKGEL